MLKGKMKLVLWSGLALSIGLGGQALAKDNYPTKPISLIIPYAAGGTTDVIGRALADGMSRYLKQTVVVENKPGAAGSMGANEMVRAKPDGYEIALTPVGIFRQPYLQKTRYDPIKDLSYIAAFANYDFAIAVAEDSPIQTIQEYVKFIQDNPGKMDFGSPGRFTGNQVVLVELLTAVNGEALHVPFKSDSESITALLGGQIQSVVSTNVIMPFMKSGKVRVLATAADERPLAYADVTTLKEAGYPVVVPSPLGLAGPKNLPEPIVLKLEEAVKAAMETDSFKKTMLDYGVQTKFINHTDYSALAKEIFKNEESIVKRLGQE